MRSHSHLVVVVLTGALVATTSSAFAADRRPCKPDQGGPQGNTVQQANRSADTAADRLNRDLVGNAQQNENERQAEAPRGDCIETATPDKDRKGATLRQRDDRNDRGQTSMQPNADDSGLDRTVRDATQATDHPGHYDPFAIEIDPLGLFVGGRLSFNAEWAPATHHVIQLSPHIVHTTADVAVGGNSTVQQAFSGVGTEIGYRYYTGHRGMNGVFVGPSFIVGAYDASLPNGETPFTDVGIAADVGLQEILWNHLVLGGGVGIEYLEVSHDFGDLPSGPSTIASSGFKPRLLLEAGYGF